MEVPKKKLKRQFVSPSRNSSLPTVWGKDEASVNKIWFLEGHQTKALQSEAQASISGRSRRKKGALQTLTRFNHPKDYWVRDNLFHPPGGDPPYFFARF